MAFILISLSIETQSEDIPYICSDLELSKNIKKTILEKFQNNEEYFVNIIFVSSVNKYRSEIDKCKYISEKNADKIETHIIMRKADTVDILVENK